jgi:hypothetical protein
MSDLLKETIQSKIFSIRGLQVMLDKDLATFYEVKPFRLREQVKRNPDRFPTDFIFQLIDSEVDLLVSQNAIPSKQLLGGTNPYVFTEQGVAALSGVLKSEKATLVSVEIFRAFVRMRRAFVQNALVMERVIKIEQKQFEFDNKLNELLNALQSPDIKQNQGVFFDGQLFDAYVFATDLIKSAQHSIILIDNYIDETTLLMLSKRKLSCEAIIYTQKINNQLQLDLAKHNEQYPLIHIKLLKNAHDRFLIIDKNELYHIGASLKDLGKKCLPAGQAGFAFSRINDFLPEILNKLGKS